VRNGGVRGHYKKSRKSVYARTNHSGQKERRMGVAKKGGSGARQESIGDPRWGDQAKPRQKNALKAEKERSRDGKREGHRLRDSN